MNLTLTAPGVFHLAGTPGVLDRDALALVLAEAQQAPRRRARVCLHRDDAEIHEMFIVLLRGSYIRPHLHRGKSESFHLMTGTAGVVFFDSKGTETGRAFLSAEARDAAFFYRIDTPIFHTQVVLSDYVLFHEVTHGPFRREDTLFADWAPREETSEADAFLARLTASFSERIPA